jgi:3-hydroxyethyl bacteriochlorophyllide a dehydrogenase
MKTQAILFTAPHQVALGSAEIPAPGPGEVLVEAHYSCISPGTELRSLAGLQAGTTGWPFIPGYAQSGVVVETGPGVDLAVGTRVFTSGTTRADRLRLWGGHVAHAVVPADRAFALPEGMDMVTASIAKLVAIAYRGVRLARPMPHELVAVVGLGPIGQLSARLFHMTGARVVGVDLSPARVDALRAAGIDATVPAGDMAAHFRSVAGRGADIVVDATGVAAVLPQSIMLADEKPFDDSLVAGARLVIQGSYPDGFTLPYQESFRREFTIHIPRDQQPRDLRAVLDLMASGRVDVRGVISDVRPPAAAPETYAALQANKGDLLTVAYAWQQGA